MNPMLILEVMRFELKRSMTKGRILIWLVLVGFPVSLFFLLGRIVDSAEIEFWGFLLFFLVTEILILLGLLLWASPAVSTEIEGQTWIYLAMRRSGRSMVLFGKYLTAVAWSLSASLTALTLSMWFVPDVGGPRLWWVLATLCLFASLAYAAIFIMIGVFIHRRTMVTAVFYALAIECGLSFVPAFANKITVQYRLRGLLATWMDWHSNPSIPEELFGTEPTWVHLIVLFAITSCTLFAAVFALQRSQYPTQQDG